MIELTKEDILDILRKLQTIRSRESGLQKLSYIVGAEYKPVKNISNKPIYQLFNAVLLLLQRMYDIYNSRNFTQVEEVAFIEELHYIGTSSLILAMSLNKTYISLSEPDFDEVIDIFQSYIFIYIKYGNPINQRKDINGYYYTLASLYSGVNKHLSPMISNYLNKLNS